MGNAQTKERSPHDPARRSSASGPAGERSERSESSRSLRGRHNIESSLFGLSERAREHRERDREAERAAREQRRREREKERLRERERSLREERVDGGFLVTMGVYTGPEDFKDKVVRQLMIERRLAPFFRGLRDHDPSWTDAQLVAAANNLPIPDASAPPPTDDTPPPPPPTSTDTLTVPIVTRARSHSHGSGDSRSPALSLRSRSKTTSGTPPPPHPPNADLANDPSRFVGGRPLEALLYERAIECPICFLYYPPWLNKTRCCDQEICSECFVQIKRADPHIPDPHEIPPNTTTTTSTTTTTTTTSPAAPANPNELISTPATCPFCKTPDFGVTYTPPPFRRGLHLKSQPASPAADAPAPPASPRRSALPLSNPSVVTTDMIRPDWAHKLASARAHAARRAAAATALHTAAFLMQPRQPERDAAPPRRQDRAETQEERRAHELEEMMLMEAIRLSLVEEEARKGKGKAREERAVAEAGRGGAAGEGSAEAAGKGKGRG